MQSGGDKLNKSDPVKVVVQTGEIGFFPFNSLGISAICHNQSNYVIGSKDDTLAAKLKNQSEFVVSEQSVAIKNRVFAGLSDAFYRGKLPELVLITSDMANIPAFIEEFMDFLEKLCSLGFLSQQQEDNIILLDRYIPLFVIGSYGVVFDVLSEKLGMAVDNLANLSARQKDRLLQKFSRVIFTSPAEGYDLNLNPPVIFSEPIAVNLAGSKSMYTIRTTQLLESHKIQCHFNPNGEVGILEWELNLAYKHIVNRILPMLASKNIATDFTQEDLCREMEQLGQKSGILPGLVTLLNSKTSDIMLDQLTLAATDLAIVHQARLLAQEADITQLVAMLDKLLHIIKEQLKYSSLTMGNLR